MKYYFGSAKLGHFLQFSIVGSACFLLQLALLVTFVEALGLSPVVASGCGYVIAAIGNYLANRTFTFQSHVRHGAAAPRFVVLAISGLLLNMAAMALLLRVGVAPYVVAQIITTGLVLVWNYWWSAKWVYTASRESS